MRTLFIALLMAVTATVCFGRHQSAILTPDQQAVCVFDTLTAAEVCTLDVSIPYNVHWGPISASVYLDSITGSRTDSLYARAMYFPNQYVVGMFWEASDSTWDTWSVHLDTVVTTSAYIPIAWRDEAGAADTLLNWGAGTGNGYYTSYVPIASAGSSSDQFSPNAGGFIRFLISQPTTVKFMLCLSYFTK